MTSEQKNMYEIIQVDLEKKNLQPQARMGRSDVSSDGEKNATSAINKLDNSMLHVLYHHCGLMKSLDQLRMGHQMDSAGNPSANSEARLSAM